MGLTGRLLLAVILAFGTLALRSPRPVSAAAVVTFELFPAQPAAGQSAELVVRTWAPRGDGTPNLSWPVDTTGYLFDVRAYRAAEFPGGYAPGWLGFAVKLEQADRHTWRAEVVFAEAGAWVVVFRNWYPPLTPTPPPSGTPVMLEVLVQPQPIGLPRTGHGLTDRSAGTSQVLLAFVAFIITAAGIAACRRRHSRSPQRRRTWWA